ncbi:MAG: helix-turn-helix transcriptional regulator [Pyrinomonadaceae bacterium]
MSKQPPDKPLRLAEKLLQIRKSLDLSQNALLSKLGAKDKLFRSNISQYELGTREPSLTVILSYARLANVFVDVLIDDELDLPKQIPSPKRFSGTLDK